MYNTHKIITQIYLFFLANGIQLLEKDPKMVDVLKPAWQSRKAWDISARNSREQKRGHSFLSDFKYLMNCWRAITSRDTSEHQLHGVYNRTRFLFHQIHIFIAFSKKWSLFFGKKPHLKKTTNQPNQKTGNKNNKELYLKIFINNRHKEEGYLG